MESFRASTPRTPNSTCSFCLILFHALSIDQIAYSLQFSLFHLDSYRLLLQPPWSPAARHTRTARLHRKAYYGNRRPMALKQNVNGAIYTAVSLILTFLSRGSPFQIPSASLKHSQRTQHPYTTSTFRRSESQRVQSKCQAQLMDDGPGLSEEESLLRSIQYKVVSHYKVERAEAKDFRILSILTTHFPYNTTIEARHACRMGEIIVSRRIQNQSNQTLSTARILPSSSLTVDKTLSIAKNKFDNATLLVATPLTSLQENDQILQITRRQSEKFYPVELTGYVLHPSIDVDHNHQTSSSSTILLPTVIYHDEHVAIVERPKDMLLSGVSRTNNLQSFLPFLLTPPNNTTIVPQVVFQRAGGASKSFGGLVVVAKSQVALEKIQQYFDCDNVHFGYIAIVQCNFDEQISSRFLSDHSTLFEGKVVKRNKSLAWIEFKTCESLSELQICNILAKELGATVLRGSNPITVDRYNEEQYLFLNTISFAHPSTEQRMEFFTDIPAQFYERFSEAKEPQSSLLSSTTSLATHLEQCYAELGEKFTTQEGTACTGEPPIDPSKMIRPNQGDSEWVDDW